MATNQIFKKYYNKLLVEGLLKSLVCGLAIGFAVMFAVAIGIWFTTLPVVALVLIPLGSGFAVTAACTAAFYFTLFRPTTDKMAKRLDSLGLEERLITMLELENDQSYIAMRQREDARQQLNRVSAKTFKFRFNKAPIIVASISCALAVGMTTVAGMSGAGLIERGMDFVDDMTGENDPVYYTVGYEVMGIDQNNMVIFDESGLIDGDIEQIISQGDDGSEVFAVADDGWAFAAWIVYVRDKDGNEVESYQDEVNVEPVRTETAVMNNMRIVAVFQEVGEGEGEGGGDGDSDEPQDNDNSNAPSGGETPPDGDPSNNSTGGSAPILDNNMIIDNETYYRTILGDYYDIIMQYISEGKDIPADLKAIIELYYGIIL